MDTGLLGISGFFWHGNISSIISAVSVKRVGSAIGRWLLNMTVDEGSFEQYYVKYAPRTHGLPTPEPLHTFPRGREFYKKLGEPKRVVAPMVDQSELVFHLETAANYRHGESFLDVMVQSCVIRP